LTTQSQLIRNPKSPRRYKNRRPNLDRCPQKKGTCLKVFLMTPRKPNSALRKVAKVLLSNRDRVHAYIPGIGHRLQKYSTVLVRGGRVKDLPGMKYTMIRGKYDLKRIEARRNARSKYGTKKIYTRADHRFKKYYYY
jgi:small subunit ribosomal protein S12